MPELKTPLKNAHLLRVKVHHQLERKEYRLQVSLTARQMDTYLALGHHTWLRMELDAHAEPVFPGHPQAQAMYNEKAALGYPHQTIVDYVTSHFKLAHPAGQPAAHPAAATSGADEEDI